MTTWTTFETLDESAHKSDHALQLFYVDRLGMVQFGLEDDRTRFVFAVAPKPDMTTTWSVMDLQAEDDQDKFTTGTMKECVQWMSGRVLYGV